MTDDRHLEPERPNRFLTLGISSLASIVAAIVTSEFWRGGVVGAAAITPVIIALVTDLLSPLARARREAEDAAARAEDAAAMAAAPQEPASRPRPPRWGFFVGGLLAGILIGLVAFLLAAVILTVPEVAADQSITGDGGETTFFGDNAEKPWGKVGSWSECFDDIEQCLKDIVEQHR